MTSVSSAFCGSYSHIPLIAFRILNTKCPYLAHGKDYAAVFQFLPELFRPDGILLVLRHQPCRPDKMEHKTAP